MAHGLGVPDRNGRRQGIHPEAAHGVGDARRLPGVQARQPVGDAAAVDPGEGSFGSVGRRAGDQGVGVGGGLVEQRGQGRQIVLAVGIDLHAVGEAARQGPPGGGLGGGPLAPVGAQPDDVDIRADGQVGGIGGLAQPLAVEVVAAVVGDDHRQARAHQPGDDRADGPAVVVMRNQRAEPGGGRRESRRGRHAVTSLMAGTLATGT